jgi:hypothetical protein
MPTKRRKSPSKAQDSTETTENQQSLQRRPQIVNQNGVTGLTVSDAKATAIAALLSQGFSTNRIAKELSTSHHTITAIARNRPELVEQFREVTGRNWRVVAALATGELVERIPEMSNNHLGIVAGIATDKAELLSGGATSRVEHTHKPSADEWADMLASLPEADCRVIEVAPAGKALPIEAVTVDGSAGLIGNASQPGAPTWDILSHSSLSNSQSHDVQSPVSYSADTVKPPVVSTLVPTPLPLTPPAPVQEGGGEGASFSVGHIDPHLSTDEKFFTKHSPSTNNDKRASY